MSLTTLEIITLSFYAVMAIITIAANGTVILSMVLIKRLRNTSNYFIVSLSCADLSIGLITLPLRSMEILRFPFTYTFESCRVSHVFTLFNFTASVSNLVVITIDRYIAIIHPCTYIRLKCNQAQYIFGMIFAAWLPVILLTCLPLYGWGSNSKTGERLGTKGICRFSETMKKDFLLTVLITVLATSFFLIVPLYGRIFKVARSQMTRVHAIDKSFASPTEAAPAQLVSSSYDAAGSEISSFTQHAERLKKIQEQRQRRKAFLHTWKITKTMFLIVIIFLISWMAFVIPTSMFIAHESNNATAVLASTVIIYAGSAANPFVYFIRFKAFQTEIKRIWKRSCCST